MYFDPDWIFAEKHTKQYPNITGLMGNNPSPANKKEFTTLGSLADVFASPRKTIQPPQQSQQIQAPYKPIINTDPIYLLNQSTQAELNAKQYELERKAEWDELKKGWTYITDRRTTHPVTGKPMNPNKDLFSDRYDPNKILKIFQSAQKYGVDPYDALSIAMQETNIGNKTRGADVARGTRESVTELERVYGERPKTTYDELAAYLKLANDRYKDVYNRLGIKYSPTEEDVRRIQYYNGLGVIGADSDLNSDYAYGINIKESPIDPKVNPVYGKTVMSIRDQLIKDPDIQRIYNSVYGTINQ